MLCNIYAPTTTNKLEQNNFIQLIKSELAPHVNENIIIGGDFNLCLNPKIDRQDNMSHKNDNLTYRNEVSSLLESMELSDCFRILFPSLRRYTWHSRGKSFHLDYFFISEHLLNDLESFKILPGLHSDHSILKIKLVNSNPTRGKGIWKFNNSLLHDINYVTEIKKIILNCEIEYKNLQDRGLAWEMTKMEIRSFSVPFCVKKGKKEMPSNYH